MIQDWHPRSDQPIPGYTGDLAFRPLTRCTHLWCTILAMLRAAAWMLIALTFCPPLALVLG